MSADLLDQQPSVDIHAHPGRFHRDNTGLEQRIRQMVRGGLSAGFFCVSTDRAVIRRDREVGRIRAHRAFEPGESYRDTCSRFAVLDPWFAEGHLPRVLSPADVLRAKRTRRPGAILAAEGADFLEERIDRVQEAHDRGIRSIQLVHYNINAVADIQTEEPRHHGLTPFGAQVIREMNRLGLIVDVAHATEQVTRNVVDITTRPIMLSHTALRRTPRKYTRFIYADHARLIASTGGVIGVWPAGRGGLERWTRRFRKLADLVGPEHLAVGTDMDGLRNTVFDDYAELPNLAAALLAAGFSKSEAAGILGGNFMRVFGKVAEGV
ncbi:MAG: membrane dipeptidase [Deltaproteobacteria bacterium]|nr:membrane dipeptidase [Deltaproteobacteria bacterium]